METLNNFSKTLAGMPLAALVVLVVLSGFALAAYAIHAVTLVAKSKTKERR